MNLYRADVKIAGTAYVKANSKAEADRKLKALNGQVVRIEGDDGELEVCGAEFTSKDLPEVSLSPAMTCKGRYSTKDPIELAAENVPEQEKDNA